MHPQKKSFIQFALDSKVLKFGAYTLKSGRQSPYFFNAGLFYQATSLKKLGEYYADLLIQQSVDFQHLFGPAYKGIPLATATAIALSEKNINTTVTFNRKEFKTHGEKGALIGAPLSGNTVIIDDVITAGTAFRDAQHFIKEHGGKLTALVIALDRGEPGATAHRAICEIQDQGISVYSIITVFDLIDYLNVQGELAQADRLQAYLSQY